MKKYNSFKVLEKSIRKFARAFKLEVDEKSMKEMKKYCNQKVKYKKPNKNKLTPTQRLSLIRQIIESVDNRCLATDGPVSKCCDEITDEELKQIYDLTKI